MSKSLGNLFTLADLREKGFSPMEVRYTLISGHYRQPLNFTFASLKSGRSAMKKMEKAVTRLLGHTGLKEEDFLALSAPPFPGDWGHFQRAWDGLADDLNVSRTTGGIFTGFAELEHTELHTGVIRKELKALAGILYALGIRLFQNEKKAELEIPEKIAEWAEERWQAKQSKNWEQADALRNKVMEKGWKILDRKDGYDIAPVK